MELDNFDHCGIRHVSNELGIVMHQEHYVEQLRTIEDNIFSNFKEDTLLPPAHAAQYLTLLGCLAWLVLTRPDIAIFVSALHRHAKQPEVRHLRRLNNVLRW
eukprot:14117413-Heterocapsa_arctica.AAC.1